MSTFARIVQMNMMFAIFSLIQCFPLFFNSNTTCKETAKYSQRDTKTTTSRHVLQETLEFSN